MNEKVFYEVSLFDQLIVNRMVVDNSINVAQDQIAYIALKTYYNVDVNISKGVVLFLYDTTITNKLIAPKKHIVYYTFDDAIAVLASKILIKAKHASEEEKLKANVLVPSLIADFRKTYMEDLNRIKIKCMPNDRSMLQL